ncbi:hypothetical protein [Escherichia sp. E4742]|uniref:hypothetical protein n=1 Tax=Escherichia sp. E4742 TaxID=2044467 RepID=UPI001F0E549E|nr:hypothetical protein [Escherichia sp. E4742]
MAGRIRLYTLTAVSEEQHVLRHDQYAARYRECWISASGVYGGNGFLPTIRAAAT